MSNQTNDQRPPDLQEWIKQYGGYRQIDWNAWDAAVAKYQEARREYLFGR